MSQIEFGTDGWRAVISDTFTFDNVKIVAQAIVDYLLETYLGTDINIVIGYDTRFMSDKYAELISQVLAANNIKVLLSEKAVPTPVVSFTTVDKKANGGIVVTASHNPASFNGIKFKGSYGGPADPEETKQIEAKLYKTEPKIVNLDEALNNGLIKKIDMDESFFNKLKGYVDLEKIKKSNLKILVDSMHGAGTDYFERIFQGSNCTVETLHKEINPGFGGVHPEPIGYNLKELCAKCKTGVYDIGFATDGDADRIGVVDSEGNFIFSHEIIALLALYLKESRGWSGGVVKSISTTTMIDKIGEKLDIKIYETPVGFKHVCELMRTEDILVGGEESGGIGFKNHVPERDSLLSGLLLVEMMLYYDKSLKEILDEARAEYGMYFYERIDYRYDAAEKEKVFANLEKFRQKELLGIPVVKLNDTDGVKHTLEDESWLLIRASGTEPILRIYAESRDKNMVGRLLEIGKSLVVE